MSSFIASHDMPLARRRSEDEGPWSVDIESWVRLARVPESPVLDQPEPGVALAVSAAKLDEGRLHLCLHVTVKLPGPVAHGYNRPGKAVVITIHDSCGEQIGWCTLLDPNKTFPGYGGANYIGPSDPESGGMMVTRYYGVDVGFPVLTPDEAEAGPSVFVVATVNRYRSEPIRVTLTGAEPSIEPEVVLSDPPGADDDDRDSSGEGSQP